MLKIYYSNKYSEYFFLFFFIYIYIRKHSLNNFQKYFFENREIVKMSKNIEQLFCVHLLHKTYAIVLNEAIRLVSAAPPLPPVTGIGINATSTFYLMA